MNHKLKSRLREEISITSDMQMDHSNVFPESFQRNLHSLNKIKSFSDVVTVRYLLTSRGKMDIIATVFIVVNEMVGWHH